MIVPYPFFLTKWTKSSWEGTVEGPKAGLEPRFTLRRPGALRQMLLPHSDRALGEAYPHGDFDIEGKN